MDGLKNTYMNHQFRCVKNVSGQIMNEDHNFCFL